jgi:hypothetical protein
VEFSRPLTKDTRWLVHLYISRGEKPQQIARTLNRPLSDIQQILYGKTVPVPTQDEVTANRKRKYDFDLLAKMVQEHFSDGAIAEQLGINVSTARYGRLQVERSIGQCTTTTATSA